MEPAVSMIRTVELTTFKLKMHSCEEVINANSGIDAWLLPQEEFVSRRIAERDDLYLVRSVASTDSTVHQRTELTLGST